MYLNEKHLLNKGSYYLHNIEYNYCICVYIYPEEFLSNDRDYSTSFFFQFFRAQTFSLTFDKMLKYPYTLIPIFPKTLTSSHLQYKTKKEVYVDYIN